MREAEPYQTHEEQRDAAGRCASSADRVAVVAGAVVRRRECHIGAIAQLVDDGTRRERRDESEQKGDDQPSPQAHTSHRAHPISRFPMMTPERRSHDRGRRGRPGR